jgi:hypothetical protein
VPSGGVVKEHAVMRPRFIGGDREQSLLMAPDVREWLPEDHLASFALAAVEEVDLWSFMRPTASMAGAARPTSRR